MKIPYPIIIFLFLFTKTVCAQNFNNIRISEIFYSSSGNDWVEIKYCATDYSSVDISSLFVTMYYGTNEELAEDPLTLYSHDRPETPYDDRYAVIYLTSNDADETDLTGDTNRNHILEVYCHNNSSSLWNNEAVVVIDTNDSPDDGMIDFIFYSALEGSFNSNVAGYLDDAINNGAWNISGGDVRSSSVIINNKINNVSIIRTSDNDSNTSDDFKTTVCITPGFDNILKSSFKKKKTLFSPASGRQIFSCSMKYQKVNLTLFYPAEIEAKLFTSSGLLVSESGKNNFKSSGQYTLNLRSNKRIIPGLYIMLIEAFNTQEKINQKEKFITVMTK